MYKVLRIHKGAITNFLDLLNLDTGTCDIVFDDSSVVDEIYADFGFMEEGGVYDCKMELFGEFVDEKSDSSVEVTILETDLTIGNTKYMKVLINSDVYYILESDAKNIDLIHKMHYTFTRKDLIQVDDVIHADCL